MRRRKPARRSNVSLPPTGSCHMRLYPLLAAAAGLAVAASPAAAQDRQDRRAAPTRGAQSTALAQQVSQGAEQPDVILDIPNLSVEQITLEVDNLQVHI